MAAGFSRVIRAPTVRGCCLSCLPVRDRQRDAFPPSLLDTRQSTALQGNETIAKSRPPPVVGVAKDSTIRFPASPSDREDRPLALPTLMTTVPFCVGGAQRKEWRQLDQALAMPVEPREYFSFRALAGATVVFPKLLVRSHVVHVDPPLSGWRAVELPGWR